MKAVRVALMLEIILILFFSTNLIQSSSTLDASIVNPWLQIDMKGEDIARIFDLTQNRRPVYLRFFSYKNLSKVPQILWEVVFHTFCDVLFYLIWRKDFLISKPIFYKPVSVAIAAQKIVILSACAIIYGPQSFKSNWLISWWLFPHSFRKII